MSRITILLPVLTMIFTINSYAQKKGRQPMRWRIAAELPARNGRPSLGFAGLVTGVHGNKLMIAGGANFPGSMPWQGGRKKYYDDVYVYEKKDSKLKIYHQQYKLPFPVAYAASCSISLGIVYAGGENDKGILDKVMLLQWDENKEGIVVKELPALPVAITNAAATVLNDIVYIAGGETPDTSTNLFLSLDMNNISKGWKQLPHIPKALSHAVLIAHPGPGDESVYLVGGRKKNTNGISELYNSVYKFNFSSNMWEVRQSLPHALSAGTGISNGQGQLILFGGDKGETFHQTETLVAEIKNEKDRVRKRELTIRKNKLQSSHPGFSRDILLYDVVNDKWIKTGCFPFETPVTTTAINWDDTVILPSGEIRAGVRTSRLLMGTINQ